jgi:outer membrane receptor protein involved in Fe transport
VTVPKTKINGAELETAYRLFSVFTLSGNVAYLHAEIANGTESPKSPHWSGSVAGQLTQPLMADWVLAGHADVSFHSAQYLYLLNTQRIPSNKFVNARVGLERGIWGVYFVGRNLTDSQEDEEPTSINPVYATRYQTEPRSYGIEFRVNY